MLCSTLGAFRGSKMAIAKGNKFVSYIFLLVIALLLIRLGWNIIKLNFVAFL
jgi:uncharacterized protein